jgi:acetolactate decarboxylase
MRPITCQIPDSLYAALQRRMNADNETCDHIVAEALSQSLDTPIHTLFQVSTSAALVEGVYQGAVRVSRLLRHGDFGLGTFVDLDGEMAVLDGVCYQISATGAVAPVDGDRLIPYAVVTRFSAAFRADHQEIPNVDALVAACDQLRDSNNVFYAFRARGTFHTVKTRVMRPVLEGTTLKMAASAQQEFCFEQLHGTLIGLWSPGFAASFSVPGYHFHFLSEDRQKGGHVLECRASDVDIEGCSINEMHVSLPETEEFLRADLTRDPVKDLLDAERSKDRKEPIRTT